MAVWYAAGARPANLVARHLERPSLRCVHCLQVLFAYIWELTFLKEQVHLLSMLGGLSVMGGVITVAMGGKEEDKRDQAASTAMAGAAGISKGYRQTASSDEDSTSIAEAEGSWLPPMSAPLSGSWWGRGEGQGGHTDAAVLVRGGDMDTTAGSSAAAGARMRSTSGGCEQGSSSGVHATGEVELGAGDGGQQSVGVVPNQQGQPLAHTPPSGLHLWAGGVLKIAHKSKQ